MTVPVDDPIARFNALLADAQRVDRARLPEPTAFALATVGADGMPSVRMLLLKGVDDGGFVFYTNFESRKGEELRAHPQAAMCFHWQPLERQVRVEGVVSPVSSSEADAYFATRARESQIGAWASAQSRVIAQPGDLERRFGEFAKKFEGGTVPRPAHWSGFRLRPGRIEFWFGKPNRLHDREVYVRDGGEWRVERLYP